MDQFRTRLPGEGDRLERGATALAWLAVAAAVVAVFLEWDAASAFHIGDTAETGLTSGWGFLSLGVAAVAAYLVRTGEWNRIALPTIGTGVALVGIAALAEAVIDGGTGVGVPLTIIAGCVLVLAGSVGSSSARSPVLPRPLAGLSVSRPLTGAVGVAGALLVVAHLAIEAMTIADDPLADSGSLALIAVIALVALIGGLLAWSRPIAGFYLLVGIPAVAAAVASWQPSPPRWAQGVQYAPLGGTLLFVGGLTLLLSGLLELGGAGYGPTDPGRGSDGDPAQPGVD